MLAIGQEQIRVILEVAPTATPLAAADPNNLAGNPDAAERLANVGIEVDAKWPAQRLGPTRPSKIESALGVRGLEAVKSRLNKVSGGVSRVAPFDLPEWNPERPTVLFRANVPVDDREAVNALNVATEQPEIVGVYNDPEVVIAYRSLLDPALGTVAQVGSLLSCERLRASGMTGRGVPVAIVDSGINVDYLESQGRQHTLHQGLSYVPPGSSHLPGKFPVDHGTLCAFQIGISAPGATLIDHGVVGRPVKREEGVPLFKAWLSDIQPAYRRLYDFLERQPGSDRRLVVSNSWAMIDERWDFVLEDVENYSDNPHHPFNRQVVDLVGVGADILFAAGNCGQESPDFGCRMTQLPICGANALDEVITVAAVDVEGERLGYSSQGPGRLGYEKPDLCGYSHYEGSKVYPADWGTSTACPGVAGVIAALRTRYSAEDLSPRDLKELLLQSARRADGAGHSPDVGYGIVDPKALFELLP